jgi:HPr kinase/phosphorylase
VNEAPRSYGTIPVRALLDEGALHLKLELCAGSAGLDRLILSPHIQRAALAVSGHVGSVHPGRNQILGASEMSYLKTCPPRRRASVFRKICTTTPVTCFVVTGGLPPPEELGRECEAHAIPLFRTEDSSSTCIDSIQRLLDDRLAPRTTVHGDLVDVYGLGVLLLGQSGIGKSEAALDLITRGHRLVSDDVVEIRRESNVLVGCGPELTKYHMEIRGLGLLNIRDLFGISAIRQTKFIEMVVMLEPWEEGKQYDRLGIDEVLYTILDVELPFVRMPVAPGRNLAILIEVASRNQLLKVRGINAARSFVDRMAKNLERGASGSGAHAEGEGLESRVGASHREIDEEPPAL